MSISGFEESRSRVFTDFFEDFNSSSDWLFGRGLEGTVRRTIMEEGISNTIENGFLFLILKGGLIYTALFVVILLRASYLGVFKSKNDIVKALASLIFIHVVMMLYFNLPDYSTRYVLIWIFASVCFTPEMRNLSNEEVHYAINSKLK
jgi:predicted membrane protein